MSWYDQLDIFKPKSKFRQIIVEPERTDELVIPRLGAPLQFTEEWDFLSRLRVEVARYKRTMGHPGSWWWKHPLLRKQIELGLRTIVIELLAATENEIDKDLHQEIQRRFHSMKKARGKRKKIEGLLYICTWAIGQKDALWKQQYGYDEAEMALEDYDGNISTTEKDIQETYR